MFVQREARRLRLSGWVRNTEDGDVETIAEGAGPALREFLNALRRGPSGARVDGVNASWSHGTGEFVAFSVRYD
jgi:acylphosphatase